MEIKMLATEKKCTSPYRLMHQQDRALLIPKSSSTACGQTHAIRPKPTNVAGINHSFQQSGKPAWRCG